MLIAEVEAAGSEVKRVARQHHVSENPHYTGARPARQRLAPQSAQQERCIRRWPTNGRKLAWSLPVLQSGAANEDQFRNADHAVEEMGGDGDLIAMHGEYAVSFNHREPVDAVNTTQNR